MDSAAFFIGKNVPIAGQDAKKKNHGQDARATIKNQSFLRSSGVMRWDFLSSLRLAQLMTVGV